jgi:hypothetical protein
MSVLPEVNDVLQNIKMGRDRMDVDIAIQYSDDTPLLVRPRSTPPIGARSARASIDATGSPSVTRSPMRAAVLNRPACGA